MSTTLFRAIAQVFVLAIGYLAAHPLVEPWPAFAPREAQDWLPYVALAALALGVIATLESLPGWVRVSIAVLAAGSGIVLFFRLLPTETRPSLGIQAIQACAVVAFWWNLDALAQRLPRRVFWPIVVVLEAGLAASLLISGSMSQGKLGFAFAGMTALVCCFECLYPSEKPPRAAAVVLAAMTSAQVLGGLTFSELRVEVAALLAAGPMSAWILTLGPLRKLAVWKQALVALATASIAIGSAVSLALYLSPPLAF